MDYRKIVSGRISYYDNLKFALILLVVLGHAFINHGYVSEYVPSFLIFVYAFHMPLFIFVTGLFHQNIDIRQRIIYLCVCLLLTKLIEFFMLVIEDKEGKFSFFDERTFGWFLCALCIYYVVMWILRGVDPCFILIISIIVGCFSGYDESIMSSQLWGRIIVFFPFYVMGRICKKEMLVSFLHKYRLYVSMIGFMLITAWGGTA